MRLPGPCPDLTPLLSRHSTILSLTMPTVPGPFHAPWDSEKSTGLEQEAHSRGPQRVRPGGASCVILGRLPEEEPVLSLKIKQSRRLGWQLGSSQQPAL